MTYNFNKNTILIHVITQVKEVLNVSEFIQPVPMTTGINIGSFFINNTSQQHWQLLALRANFKWYQRRLFDNTHGSLTC